MCFLCLTHLWTVRYIPYSRCQSLKPGLVFLNRASYGRRRNNDVTSQEREVTMMLRNNLRTDAQLCGKSASQAYLFVRHGRGVNRPLSRRLDRCDRVIHAERVWRPKRRQYVFVFRGDGYVTSASQCTLRSLRENPLWSIDVRESPASLSIAMAFSR